MSAASQPSSRAATEDAFLDAAERLLIGVGYSGITTRRLADEAGANHGLVHYYFGSMENLFVRVLERFTEQLVGRQRAMYARTDISGAEKWKTAMSYLESDLAAGYPKIWLELQALGWNRPDIAERVAKVNGEWREVLTDAFDGMMDEYGLDRRALPAHGGGEPGDDVQRGDHGRAPVRDLNWPRGADGHGRPLARVARRDETVMTTTEAHTRQPVRAEQTRARYPDESGYVERDGVKLYWEVYGSGEQTVFLLPTWSIIHSRHWKMQIPYLARHCRVLTFDGRGNGRSDRPESGY